MALLPGSRLGSYEVIEAIGHGGMGEVYRAKDTKLGRDVALKILPDTFAYDPERLARFAREAQVLATLSHPHIGAIYGLEEAGESKALVLELVEGPTLADRIAEGPIPVEEALPIARQIAEALEAAHAAGIVHRDLKPANIKLRADGSVKVLDFGLAKATGPSQGTSSSLSISPTITSPAMTQAGLILGTAAYMSPEQAKGKSVDKRADVWAFGAVLFEMLTGRRAFAGDEMSDVLASVLAREPQLAAIPDSVPERVRQVLKACLQKDPKQRIHDMADVRLAMDGAFESPRAADTSLAMASPASRWRGPAIVAAVLVAAALAGLAGWALKPAAPAAQTKRFIHRLGEESFTRTGRPIVGISADAKRVAYVANQQIYLRNMDDPLARPIPGTSENPSTPVFSPDGAWVAYWASSGELKKIQIAGGTPVPLTKAANPLGMWWSPDGWIVYAAENGIWRVLSNGGVPEQIVKPADGERIHAPQMLPGENAVLFTVTTKEGSSAWDEGSIVVQSLDTGGRKPVGANGANPRYLASGHLVYVSGGTLFALAFDLNARQVRGGPVPVITGIQRSVGASIGIAQYSISDDGAIVYVTGASETEVDLALVDRSGAPHALPGSAGQAWFPRLSPDETKIVVERTESETSNIWMYDVPGALWRQLTFEGGERPAWTHDGAAVTFLKGEELWQLRADFSGTPELLPGTRARGNTGPHSWSPGGDVLLYGSPAGLHAYSPGKGPASVTSDDPVVAMAPPQGTTAVNRAIFSRDGKWVAYTAGGGGTPHVYITPFPFGSGAHRKVTNEPATSPVWSKDGRELYVYAGSQGLQAREVSTAPTLTWSNPKTMFSTASLIALTRLGFANYDVTRDGRVVALIPTGTKPNAPDTHQEVQIVLNWFEELKRLVP